MQKIVQKLDAYLGQDSALMHFIGSDSEDRENEPAAGHLSSGARVTPVQAARDMVAVVGLRCTLPSLDSCCARGPKWPGKAVFYLQMPSSYHLAFASAGLPRSPSS